MKELKVTPKEICRAIEELLNENERLKSQNKLYETFFNSDVEAREKLIEKVHRLQFIIEKAIKFINENKREIELDEYLLCDCLYDKKTIELLEILQEGDK